MFYFFIQLFFADCQHLFVYSFFFFSSCQYLFVYFFPDLGHLYFFPFQYVFVYFFPDSHYLVYFFYCQYLLVYFFTYLFFPIFSVPLCLIFSFFLTVNASLFNLIFFFFLPLRASLFNHIYFFPDCQGPLLVPVPPRPPSLPSWQSQVHLEIT